VAALQPDKGRTVCGGRRLLLLAKDSHWGVVSGCAAMLVVGSGWDGLGATVNPKTLAGAWWLCLVPVDGGSWF
jgi:hypothetical protein